MVVGQGGMRAYRDEHAISPMLLHPRSQGGVTLRSADQRAPVRIRPNFLVEPEDIRTLRGVQV
jgi:choline dehydrogenase-like flavoprotein